MLVVVIGTVMGLSLSLGGGLLSEEPAPPTVAELEREQAELLAEVIARV